MRDVAILKQVLHGGRFVQPLPGGGPVLSVPDYTAEHWIATGAARAVVDPPVITKPPATGGKKGS
jgi:hypothetical protein